MKIREYLILKEILSFLEEKLYEELNRNNDYTNEPIENLKRNIEGLKEIIIRLENE